MFSYKYKAVDISKNIREGTTRGYFKFFVRKRLETDGSRVLQIQRIKTSLEEVAKYLPISSISTYERILFFRNLAMMLDAGVGIATSLETLKKQFRSMGASRIIDKVITEVEGGARLSVALSQYPKMFPEHIAKTIAVGEESGTLSRTLEKIAEDLEKNYELKRKVSSAIAYPVIILIFMAAASLLIVIFVLPQLIKLYGDLGAKPPFVTLALMNVGTFILDHPVNLLLILLVAVLGFSLLMKVRSIRYFVHYSFLYVPVVGNLIREYNLVRLTRALTTLLGSGITFIHALDACKSTLQNEAYKQKVDTIYPFILHGGKFSDAIEPHPHLFPEQMRQAIIVGENAGKLKDSFDHTSIHYERSVHYQTQMLTTMIEPFLMLFAGGLVGLLAYSVFAPLYQVTTLF